MLPDHKQAVYMRHPDPFPDSVIESIKQHAVEQYPKESCGFVLPDSYMPCENVHSNPEEGFEVHPDDVKEALQRGALAMVHSHPNGPNYPSYVDQKFQIESGMTWGVIPVIGVDDAGPDIKARASDIIWWGDDLPAVPYKRRRFVWGVWHCYALYRDWMWHERGVRIPNFACDPNFVDMGHNIFVENCERAGLRNLGKIDMNDLQVGDMLVGHLRGTFPNHCGIYLGGDSFLHHPEFGASGEADLLRWWKYIDTVMRYDGGSDPTSLR